MHIAEIIVKSRAYIQNAEALFGSGHKGSSAILLARLANFIHQELPGMTTTPDPPEATTEVPPPEADSKHDPKKPAENKSLLEVFSAEKAKNQIPTGHYVPEEPEQTISETHVDEPIPEVKEAVEILNEENKTDSMSGPAPVENKFA